MKLLVFGATGTSGGEVVRQAILDPQISEIIVVARRPLDFTDPKIKLIIHQNYLDYGELSKVLKVSMRVHGV